MGNFAELTNDLPYNAKAGFQELESDCLYLGLNVCTSSEVRGKGLGTELVRRAHQLAVKAGCSHTYIFSTGRFSQRIFQNLGYQIMHEIKYADYEKDKRGRPFLDNHGDHTVLQVVALQHEAASN